MEALQILTSGQSPQATANGTAGSGRSAGGRPMTGRLLRLLCLGGFLAMLALAPGCAPIRYDHDLVGKVVDSETGKPIPGAVILGYWERTEPIVGHGSFFDARETVADENGDFHLEGRRLRFFTNIEPVLGYVFKAGYDWVGIDYERLTKYGGIVRLRNISDNLKLMRDRRPPKPPEAPYEKIKEYINESDRRDIILGIRPSRYWKN